MPREDVKIPLKGFVISNGATDYRYTPNIDTVKVAAQFNMIPRTILEDYQQRKCKIPFYALWAISERDR